jgi:ABC-type lipoprotein release transport system permease subunit
VSTADDFKFEEDRIGDYGRQAEAVRSYLSGLGGGATVCAWTWSYTEMQSGTARTYVQVQATDFEVDKPYRDTTEFTAGGFPGPDAEYGVVVSSYLADKYSLSVGDDITLFIPSAFGARNAMDFSVTGIFRASAPWYDESVCVGITDYLSMAELTDISPFYKVYLEDESRINGIVEALSPLAPDFVVKGYRGDDFVRFLLSLGTNNIAMFGSMAMIIFLALLIGINSIIMTNIFDRRDEIGTLRALGFPRSVVRNLFFGESLLALLIGYAAGAAIVALIGWYFQLVVVRPPLLMLEYMFGMTRMALEISPFTLLVPFVVLFALLFIGAYRKIGVETEKQAVAQMGSR